MPTDTDRKPASQKNPDIEKPQSGLPAGEQPVTTPHVAQDATAPMHDLPRKPPSETGGQAGLEPTRYGDWEKKGRCTDF